ncbi:MAG: zinc ribbon domain-containing protein [Clostridia bacterium]|nr:zinc ribbon domain-containing protein [Clostridia bacterium]
MALISCPECGKEISSSAGQCVACGYKFTYCEACNSAEPADATFCSQCGAQLATNEYQAPVAPEQPVYEKAAHFDLWERNDQVNQIMKKVGFFVPLGLVILTLIFAFVWGFNVGTKLAEIEKYASYGSFSYVWYNVFAPDQLNNVLTISMICSCITATLLPLYRIFVLIKFGAYYKGLGLSSKDGLNNHISYLALDSKANKPKIFAKHTTLDLNFKANCVASNVSGKTLWIYPIIMYVCIIGFAVAANVLMMTAVKNVISSIYVLEYMNDASMLLEVFNNELVMFIVGFALSIVSIIVVSIINNLWLKANSAEMHKIANENGIDITNTPYGKYAQLN